MVLLFMVNMFIKGCLHIKLWLNLIHLKIWILMRWIFKDCIHLWENLTQEIITEGLVNRNVIIYFNVNIHISWKIYRQIPYTRVVVLRIENHFFVIIKPLMYIRTNVIYLHKEYTTKTMWSRNNQFFSYYP